MAETFRDLEVYRESFALVARVYRMAESLPEGQRYVLRNQLERAAISVPLNIAEGFARRKSKRDFANLLATALGSATEMLVLLDLTDALNFVSENQLSKLREDFERLIRRLGAFRQSLVKRSR